MGARNAIKSICRRAVKIHDAKFSAESFVEKCLELRQMLRHQTRRRCRSCRTPCVARTLVFGADLIEDPFEIGLDEVPSAHVARFFLAPHNFGLLETLQFEHK